MRFTSRLGAAAAVCIGVGLFAVAGHSAIAAATSVNAFTTCRALSATGCDACLANPDCGWCATTQVCVPGTWAGPSIGNCSTWDFATCTNGTGDGCATRANASSCGDDKKCSFCPELARGSNGSSAGCYNPTLYEGCGCEMADGNALLCREGKGACCYTGRAEDSPKCCGESYNAKLPSCCAADVHSTCFDSATHQCCPNGAVAALPVVCSLAETCCTSNACPSAFCCPSGKCPAADRCECVA